MARLSAVEAQRPDGAALREARALLRDGVRAVERARDHLGASDPADTVAACKGLAPRCWSVVDHFDLDGQRYVLARRNEASAHPAELSEREQQALGQAARGLSNKCIAYEMGISAATVAVLLHRAARKLGANGRGELIQKFNNGSGRRG